ncbi:unnamed protein product [Heligmosomoides polygyrus]|uniref:Ig-like domain-containing protein n=1 Tax=Heligmosomoides polygyrus TaxID=6339 RepID=A0A183G1H1_HELPZ|nr:unnamed protein product [Heligmosomoides polygyrus]
MWSAAGGRKGSERPAAVFALGPKRSPKLVSAVEEVKMVFSSNADNITSVESSQRAEKHCTVGFSNKLIHKERECTTQKYVDRNLTSVDELGEVRVLDYIPKGEFLFGEVLPRLLAPVVRKNYLTTEGDPAVFTCELPVDDPTDVQWFSKKKGPILFKTIEKQFQGRFTFDEQSRIYISKLDLEDSDEYFCYTAEKILMGVHYLRVMENDRTREIVANLEMYLVIMPPIRGRPTMRIISNPKEFNCWTPETYKAFEKTITIHIVVPMVVVNLLIVGVIFTTRHYTVTCSSCSNNLCNKISFSWLR